MARRHYRVSIEDALEAHEVAREEFGGLGGILNLDRVEAGIARPYCGYFPRIEQKAAALLEGVGSGHGFADANKRTAVILTRLLIARSDYALVEEHEDDLADTVVAIVRHDMTFDQLVGWFKVRIIRLVLDL